MGIRPSREDSGGLSCEFVAQGEQASGNTVIGSVNASCVGYRADRLVLSPAYRKSLGGRESGMHLTRTGLMVWRPKDTYCQGVKE